MSSYDSEGRLTRPYIHMYTAGMWAQRSLDPRTKVGAIITTADLRQVLAIGYNGPAKGLPHDYVRHELGNSGCIHAEENALISLKSNEGKVMFCTLSPCEMCAQKIVNAGIKLVYYAEPYRDRTGLEILKQCGITVKRQEL